MRADEIQNVSRYFDREFLGAHSVWLLKVGYWLLNSGEKLVVAKGTSFYDAVGGQE